MRAALAAALALGGCGDNASRPVDAAVDGAAATCLPVAVGPLVAVGAAGARAHLGCDGEGLVIEVPGGASVTTVDDVRAIRDRHPSSEYLAVDGVVGVGVRRCCAGSAAYCVHLDVQTHTIAIPALIAQIEAWFPPGDGCLGVAIGWIGRVDPRCDAGDPACVPEPYCAEAGGACCPVAVAYAPARAREVLTGPAVDGLSSGACQHDGECFTDGCGELCKAYTVPGEITTCACRLALQSALCGCVADRCAWFTQP